MSVLRSSFRPRWTCRLRPRAAAPRHATATGRRIRTWPPARKAAAEARTPYTSSELYKNTEGHRLSIEEMRAGRNPNNIVTTAPTKVDRQAEISRMSPDELRAFSKDEKPELQGNGLDRRYLSDPPGDLLKAQGGRRLKASSDPAPMGDPDSPSAYLRQQQSRQ